MTKVLMFLYKQVINMSKDNNGSVIILIKRMEQKVHWDPSKLIKLRILLVYEDHLTQNLIILVLTIL